MDNSREDHRMPEANKCPQCGTPLKGGALGGLCPACLLAQGVSEETVTAGPNHAFTPPAPEALAPFFSQLEILELIGKGGMGAVYKARQTQLDRLVALKILPPDIGNDPAFAERFSREARALAKLNHPGIVTIYDFGVAREDEQSGERLYYFIMEFVDGVTLRQLLNGGRISAREVLAIVPQICDALQFAHDHGIVHRDIKPENILIDRLGRVKVADFGLVKLVGGDSQFGVTAVGGSDDQRKPGLQTDLTDAGKIMGTPSYMAPEQKENPAEVDHRADIYALGVVFYQMLTGELPGREIEPPSRKVQIDLRLDEIVLRALEKNPALRYEQASVLKTQVESFFTPGSSPGDDAPAGTRKSDWRLWSPFQSPQVREIAAHFTPEEKRDAQWRGAFWGFWCAGSAGVLFTILSRLEGNLRWLALFGWMVAQVVVIPTWMRMQRQVLCSSEWARRKGMTPDQLRLFSFGDADDRAGEDIDRQPLPWSLKIVAVLFLFSGLVTAWKVVVSDWPNRIHSLNLGILGIPIGIGLLRRRPWWRLTGLFQLLFGVIGIVMVIVVGASGNFHSSVTVKFLGREITDTASVVAASVALIVIYWFLIFWMIHVLLRSDVKRFFARKGFNRPWLEWVALVWVLLHMALVPMLVRKPRSLSEGINTNAKPETTTQPMPDRAREINDGRFIAYLPDGGSYELLAIRNHPSIDRT